jgi:hypothetical protein
MESAPSSHASDRQRQFTVMNETDRIRFEQQRARWALVVLASAALLFMTG